MRVGTTFGKRFEEKFVLSESHFSDLKVDKKLELLSFQKDEFLKNTQFTDIQNIYFDSYDLDAYHDSLLKKENRHKIRIRSYAPNGVADDKFYFELKFKKEGQTLKKRVVFNKSLLQSFLNGEEYDEEEIFLLNSGRKREKVKKDLKRLSHFVHEKKYIPMLQTNYRRHAYKLAANDQVRITIDHNLNFQRLNSSSTPFLPYLKSTEKQNKLIIEFKYCDSDSLNELQSIKELLGEATGFSKYCSGIYSTRDMSSTNKVPSHWNFFMFNYDLNAMNRRFVPA